MAQSRWQWLTQMLRPSQQQNRTAPTTVGRPHASAPVSAPAPREPARYPGDFRGVPHLEFAPHPDGMADPGEVVWAWVPYEEDHAQGKDRPALVIGRDGAWLLALPLTSKDHDRDAAQEASVGRHWMDVGSGGWDKTGRPSEVRLDRVIRLDPHAVRREGAALDRARFDALAAELGRFHHH